MLGPQHVYNSWTGHHLNIRSIQCGGCEGSQECLWLRELRLLWAFNQFRWRAHEIGLKGHLLIYGAHPPYWDLPQPKYTGSWYTGAILGLCVHPPSFDNTQRSQVSKQAESSWGQPAGDDGMMPSWAASPDNLLLLSSDLNLHRFFVSFEKMP